jgi:putative ABC transport system permease protein
MFSLQRSLSFGYLRQHRTRTVLIVLSIALGVAMLAATRALNGCLEHATREAANPLSAFADLMVINAQSGVPRGLAERLLRAGIPGLEDAQPLVLGRAYLRLTPQEGRSVLLVGIDGRSAATQGADSAWGAEVTRELRVGDLGELLWKRNGALIGAAGKLDEDLRQTLGPWSGRFQVRVAGRDEPLIRVGTIRFRQAAGLGGGSFVVMDAATAGRFVFPERPEYVSQINLRLAPGVQGDPAALEQVRRRIQAVVGDVADVRTPEANFALARDVTAGLELGFAVGGAGALVVGLFLVYNALSVSVAERRHDIGVLRAVGATRGQVAGLFLGEAALLGLLGSLLGLPMGWALAYAARGPMQRFLSDMMTPLDELPLRLSWPVLVACLAAGTATAVLAALVPALQAAHEEPADAVRRAPPSARPLYLLLQLLAIALLLGAGVAAVLGREYLPIRSGVYAGIVLLLVGTLTATPLLAGVVGRAVQPLFRRFFGLEGQLAADNLTRSPGRTGLVIAALAATSALVVGISGFVRSTQTAVMAWIDQSVAADLFVTCGGSLHTASLVQPMSQDLRTRLEQLPGVDVVLGIRFSFIEFRDRVVFLLAVDADAFRHAPDRQLARNLARFPRLKEGGTVVVSENFAALNRVRAGDRLTVRGRGGPLRLEVLGTIPDYTWNRGTLMVDRAWYAREFGDAQVDLWDLYLQPGTDVAAVQRILQERWGRREALFSSTRAELHQSIAEQLHRMYNLAYAQQFVVGLVALLGVASALFISVLQRRRELGLLRAVGACRSQVLRSVLAEAALMGLIGGVLGFVVGLGLEWYVVHVMVLDEAGFSYPLVVPWAAAGTVFGLSALLATLVGLWPAYVATRLRIPEAIAYE